MISLVQLTICKTIYFSCLLCHVTKPAFQCLHQQGLLAVTLDAPGKRASQKAPAPHMCARHISRTPLSRGTVTHRA